MEGARVQQAISSQTTLTQEIKRLGISTRHKVRAIFGASEKDALDLINQLRTNKPPHEILQIERVLRFNPRGSDSIVPEHFPKLPQTREGYHRAVKLGLTKQLQVLELLSKEHSQLISDFSKILRDLGTSILRKDFPKASQTISEITARFGHSHLILRNEPAPV